MPGQLAYQHPEYVQRQWWWEFYRVSYVGGREYLKPSRLSVEFQEPVAIRRNEDGAVISGQLGNNVRVDSQWYESLLFRHNREKEWEFENRRKRAYYNNIVAPVVNSLVSHATKIAATREGDGLLTTFWEETDFKRTTKIDSVMKTGLRWAQVYGIYWGVVDVASEREYDGDGKPYLYWVSPLDVWDWSVGDDGQLEWLKQFVYVEEKRTWKDPVKPAGKFRVWDRDGVTTYVVDASGVEREQERREYSIGRVPWEPLYSRRCDDYPFPDGVALVGDVCKAANHVFNCGSLLNEILYKQTFGQLIIPTGGTSLDQIECGLNTFLGFNSNGTPGEPKYISPDPEQARVLMEAMGSAIEIARQSVSVGRGRSESSKAQASAEALELESDDKRSVLAEIADEAEDFEDRIADLVAAYRMEQPEKPYIHYSREFDLRSYQQEIDQTLALERVQGLPDSFLTQVRKDLIRRRLEGMPLPKLQTILAEVESEGDAPIERKPLAANAQPNRNGAPIKAPPTPFPPKTAKPPA